jgi:hypothetical protein
MHCDYDSKIRDQQAGYNSPNSLTHSNPDDRNKAQIKMIVIPVLGSEHCDEDGEYRQPLARRFSDPTKGKFRWGETRS